MTVKSVSVVEAKSSSNCFLDPKPYIKRPKPHLQWNNSSITRSNLQQLLAKVLPRLHLCCRFFGRNLTQTAICGTAPCNFSPGPPPLPRVSGGSRRGMHATPAENMRHHRSVSPTHGFVLREVRKWFRAGHRTCSSTRLRSDSLPATARARFLPEEGSFSLARK
jgi:hypothetical protein